MIKIRRDNLPSLARQHADGIRPWVCERLALASKLAASVERVATVYTPLNAGSLCTAFAGAEHTTAGPQKTLINALVGGANWGSKATPGLVAAALQGLMARGGVVQPRLTAPEAHAVWSQLRWVRHRLDRILSCEPSDLWTLDQEFAAFCGGAVDGVIKDVISWIFDYDWWSTEKTRVSWKCVDLASALDVRTCPYCNRQYTFSVVKKGTGDILRPDFDHFFEKSEHPLVALSFFNLVPSCTVCNSRLKHRTPFNCSDYVHPYVEGFDDYCVFRLGDSVFGSDPLDLLERPETVPLRLHHALPRGDKRRTRIEHNAQEFQLERFYERHRDVVAELVVKHQVYTDDFVKGLGRQFPEVDLRDDVVNRILWGNYTELDDLEKRPLSKLTRDITCWLRDFGDRKDRI